MFYLNLYSVIFFRINILSKDVLFLQIVPRAPWVSGAWAAGWPHGDRDAHQAGTSAGTRVRAPQREVLVPTDGGKARPGAGPSRRPSRVSGLGPGDPHAAGRRPEAASWSRVPGCGLAHQQDRQTEPCPLDSSPRMDGA